MPKIEIDRITNVNIHLDDTNLLGRAKEVRPPDVSMIMQGHKALGTVGKVELPVGFDKPEDGVEWNSFYRDAMLFAADPYRSLVLQCRSGVQRYNLQGSIGKTPLIAFLTIMSKKNPLRTFKQHENVEFFSSFTCTYIRQVLNGEELLQLDYLASIFWIGGVDQSTDHRINIGG